MAKKIKKLVTVKLTGEGLRYECVHCSAIGQPTNAWVKSHDC